MSNRKRLRLAADFGFLGVLIAWLPLHINAQVNQHKDVSSYNVVWDRPGSGAADSMSIGNGEIGLNVWTEKNGDVVFYVAKTDAWIENPLGGNGLMKIGRVRISMSPAEDTNKGAFRQVLNLRDGSIRISENDVDEKTWVDANRPVIHVQEHAGHPVTLRASFETWYSAVSDHISAMQMAPHTRSSVAWYHCNGTRSVDAVRD